MTETEYISREICVTWVVYEGSPGIYFGKHPWRIIRSFPAAASDGAAELVGRIVQESIAARMLPVFEGRSLGKVTFEWVGGAPAEASDDRGAILLFLPPALDRLAEAAGMPAKAFASALVDDLADVLDGLGKRQFGDAFTFASRQS